ncbi:MULTISPECIES: MFS transporter [unclassified Pseudomonas]|uniref:MFS transporter n=1 Tax=unclassified Pseudomonas TaxID=196821 RepID=UPI000BD62234|nr:MULTISPECIES: MFS transporter [unclassified Pseudomonas]PVZ13920.1 DHA1 family inner membrane transport protein [Pseudomonas sp. URIL14HWK12:I12]PVZ24226.1 DHA1 family inner membrane transport protein [Pseudomonas sp. URIL14HWK12:I10]PVZ33135.1 DHA1 family inner membrane transport protein [Pseudomonas sp. URIL14HWK12:I11]SNZ10488.1 MFS transporter, DHA1 family, arabinose polymer transporter [Pseudomonas sp. URIL14HWK12:I9]
MTAQQTHAPALPARSALKMEAAMAVGSFAIGTGEFSIMGLMPDIAHNLGLSEPQVGHAISAYALGVMVGAPLLAILGARLKRKHMLLWLMALYALGNLATAFAPTFGSLIACRFIAGLPHGAYFGIAAVVASSMVAAGKRAGAVARVMSGLTLAMLLGNPIATFLGQLAGWQSAFVLVGGIALVTIGLVNHWVPSPEDEQRSDPRKELQAFSQPQVWMALLIGAIGFAGMFCVFSYLAPTMLEVTRVTPQWIPFGLAAFGVGGILGNIAGGKLFDRLGFRAVGVLLVWAMLVLLLFPFAASSLWGVLLGIGLVGTMVSLAAPLQIRLMDIAANAPSLAAASNHAAFNLANALGPWLGGMAITAGLGWTSTGFIGAATALAGLGLFILARRLPGGD